MGKFLLLSSCCLNHLVYGEYPRSVVILLILLVFQAWIFVSFHALQCGVAMADVKAKTMFKFLQFLVEFVRNVVFRVWNENLFTIMTFSCKICFLCAQNLMNLTKNKSAINMQIKRRRNFTEQSSMSCYLSWFLCKLRWQYILGDSQKQTFDLKFISLCIFCADYCLRCDFKTFTPNCYGIPTD